MTVRIDPGPPDATPPRDADRYGSMSFVPALALGWGARSDPQRIELYTRWSFYGTIAVTPLLHC